MILIGRLTKDPDVRVTQGGTSVARYGLAVDRQFKREGEPDADFLNCVVFGKAADFAQNWLHKGMKIAVTGRIQTGSYTNQQGVKVFTTDIIIDSQEFCESKSANDHARAGTPEPADTSSVDDGFINIPDTIDEELPFH